MVASPPVSESTRFDRWCRSQLTELGRVTRSARTAGSDGFAADAFASADVLSVRFADGSVLHTRPHDFLAHHAPAVGQGVAARGARAGHGVEADKPARIVLPFELPLAGALATRGAPQTIPVESYALVRLTEPTTLDRLYDFGSLFAPGLDRWFGTSDSPAAKPLAGKLCAAYENATLDPSVGDESGALLYWHNDTGTWAPAPPKDDDLRSTKSADANDERLLLLLHGTASSTAGSFGKLWRPDDTHPVPAPDFAAAITPYRHVLAWEHRSLTRSPLDNAIALLDALDALARRAGLPAGCRLDIVSHSRGGMIGELLSLAGIGADETVFAESFKSAYPDTPALHPDRERVDEFFAALDRRRHVIGTFVRVACPARGTLLADRRTDLFLSLMLRCIGLAFGTTGVPLYDRFDGLVQALVAARADARTLPGLEAMIPGSPLTLALNTTASGRAAQVPGRLRVVAGDTRGFGWGGVATFLGDLFYGLHDHDFVVHTHSMFGGFLRDDARSLRVEDKSVTHFGYFNHGSRSRQPLLAVLAGRDDGWQPLADDERRTRNWVQVLKREPLLSRVAREKWLEEMEPERNPRKPVLVVLPGIMGSELSLGDAAPVWLSASALVGGTFEALNLASPKTLTASGLVAVAYERLLEEARKIFNVVTFAFDWRAALADSGDELRTLLEDLDRDKVPAGVPIHLLAHSMGGLVARQALFDGPGGAGGPLWKNLTRRGGRLLMLGTPNAGSYAPVQLLLQQHNLSRLLALLARNVSSRQLAQWAGSFPGLMAMLPQQEDPVFGSFFKLDTWRAIQRAEPRTQPPDRDVLENARQQSERLRERFENLKKDPNVLYVAGRGPTPVALRRRLDRSPPEADDETATTPSGGVGFAIAADGDGTVGWDSVLDRERTWYAPCEHGDLADCKEAFEAYFELLKQGRTLRLSQHQRPVRTGAGNEASRGAADAPAPVAATVPDRLPSLPDDVTSYVLGMRRSAAPSAEVPPIEVRVVHGSLDYARYPLLVGHYLNDYVTGAAKRVDEKLAGQLQRVIDLKLFEGAAHTGVYLRPKTADTRVPPYGGALVIGLGNVGDLTPGRLAETVARGVLRFAFEHVHRDPFVDPHDPLLLRLSTLLIGTHLQAVTPRDSLAGVLQGVWRAAQLLSRDTSIGRPVQLVELEIVEIEEAVALDAAYRLRELLKRPEWSERLYWQRPVLESRDGGLRGYRPLGHGSVWQRLVIEKDAAAGGLRYALIAERARVESTRVFSDVHSLHDYISRLSDAGAVGRSADAGSASLGRVLFHLLLPQDLKGRLANFDNTVLVLDDETARQPWELLMPPNHDGAGSEETRPLAIQAGMVRQRITGDFRRLPNATPDWNALIIGAPDTSGWKDEQGRDVRLSPLPGAYDEARAVEQSLRNDGRSWNPLLLTGKDASFERVRTALLERPYRLLHLAGHGVVDCWVADEDLGNGFGKRRRLKTGMLLSHQHVLEAADVEQIDPAPEFVFINCCYSARDAAADAAPGIAQGRRNYPVLAAGLALQFVKMGARAVVAAGWQVGDAEGQNFAQTLYREMLLGRPFGDAVREARSSVWRPGTQAGNTWGAYQCYGDPEWRLGIVAGIAEVETQGAPRSARRTASSATISRRYAGFSAAPASPTRNCSCGTSS